MKNTTTNTTNFLEKTNTIMSIEFLKRDYHFDDDKEKRNIFKITLNKGKRKYTFEFGDSLLNTYGNNALYKEIINKFDLDYGIEEKKLKYIFRFAGYGHTRTDIYKILHNKPTEYDVLACLEVFDINTFDDFCSYFGYSNDSIKARNIFKKVIEQEKNLKILYNDDEIEILNNIE